LKLLRSGFIDEIYRAICSKNEYICYNDLEKYPRNIKKALRYHERKLLKALRNTEILRKITINILTNGKKLSINNVKVKVS